MVIEVVYEYCEAPGLVLQGQRQYGNITNEDSVKDSGDLQIVTGPKRLEYLKQSQMANLLKFYIKATQNKGPH